MNLYKFILHLLKCYIIYCLYICVYIYIIIHIDIYIYTTPYIYIYVHNSLYIQAIPFIYIYTLYIYYVYECACSVSPRLISLSFRLGISNYHSSKILQLTYDFAHILCIVYMYICICAYIYIIICIFCISLYICVVHQTANFGAKSMATKTAPDWCCAGRAGDERLASWRMKAMRK